MKFIIQSTLLAFLLIMAIAIDQTYTLPTTDITEEARIVKRQAADCESIEHCFNDAGETSLYFEFYFISLIFCSFL